ncbi:Protocadherin-15 [Orchesella cincta]|uniref:Protocadherin-15 n=1 Tax=Orchesella cincta TaxID=48709 RepID=A0A1D2NAL9_ORCCI|nr:Protocadherin-15 [Orchesella cincta]
MCKSEEQFRVTSFYYLFICIFEREVEAGLITDYNADLCRLENGLSSIIVDIEESVGDETAQTTTPQELPIIGDPWNQIDLTLVQHEKRYFRLHGKKLQLSQPLDRDEDDISSIVFQAVCVIKSTRESRTIPVIARISDRNDNSPKFIGEPFEISIPEDRAFDPKLRRSSTTTLTINVVDSDDQPPAFHHSVYNATVIRSVLTGVLDVKPGKILATDKDSINAPIHYAFVNGTPASYLSYFLIDGQTGIVRQIRPIDNDQETTFEIYLKATEVTEARRSAYAKLVILVKALNSHPPIIQSNSLVGYVDENSAVGTPVLSLADNQPIHFTVSDPDLTPNDPKPEYHYELTTSGFKVNDDGILVVADQHLDRDPPNPPQLQFQMIAREVGDQHETSSSTPLVILVHLKDKNDNSPFVRPLHTIIIPGGGDGRRTIFQVEADDKDEGDNAKLQFAITHVSNNGTKRFMVHEKTGAVDAVGKFNTGEHFSITVQATDGGGRSSQRIVEVNVIDGPNLKAPVFSQLVYDVGVSEGASIGAEVITLEARDPEGKPVIYDIVAGNELQHFTIGKNTGILSVNGQLDREDLSRYSLNIKAADDGGLHSIATVNIRVIDINDKNPQFLNLPYNYKVKEGQPGKLIGRVEAKDEDEDVNGEIRFEIPDNSPFNVDRITGEVSTKTALDYEKQKVHYVVVTARDNSPSPRIATATMTIAIEDVPDTEPVFNRFTYEVNIPENLRNSKVTRVEAMDPDTEKRITYFIKQGPFDKFNIDPITGDIYTTQGLDYERNAKHVLIIGTEENDSGNLGSTTTVIVNVVDENDVPPIFNVVPRPIRLDDTSHVGMVITKLEATDSDGTSPFNKVKYEITGRGKAARYFDVNHDTGEVSIKDDLRKEMDTEYHIDVRAYDLGEPQLSSVATVKVNVDHVATVAPDVGVGFSETEYSVDVLESAVGGTLLKTLVIINKQDEIIPIECQIISGNEDGLFTLRVNKDRNCELKLTRTSLDHEKVPEYLVQVKLLTLPGVISKKNSQVKIKIRVVDENDNKPEFQFPDHQKIARGKKLYGAISEDSQISTSVIQIRAEDKDSGTFHEITYELEAENDLARSFFTIDSKSGIVSNTRTLDDVSPALLPFRLTVSARDNPKGPTSASQISQIPLIVNIIGEPHRMVLIIQGTTPDKVKSKEKDILEILQDTSTLIIGIEKISAHRYLTDNGTLDLDSTATDVWFYAVDPINDHILDREHPKVTDTIMSRESSKGISYYVSSSLGVRATEVRKPITRAPLPPAPVGTLESEQQWAAFPAALVALACLIFIVSSAGICFVCYKWSRYNAYKNQMQRIVVPPRSYEPVYVDHSPSLKQYETQVLNMRVQGDELDIDDSDLQMDLNLSRNHMYMDGSTTGYNSRDSLVGSQWRSSSPSSHAGGTRPASDVSPSSSKTPILKTFQTRQLGSGDKSEPSIVNPIYERSDDDEMSISSQINDNVHFRGKRDYARKPTTEL